MMPAFMAASKIKVFETKDSGDIEQAIHVISVAVENDPNKVYYFPDREDRAKHTKFMVEKLFRSSEKDNRVIIGKVGSQVVGSSMWFPPGYQISYTSLIRNGLLKTPFLFGLGAFIKMIQSLSIADKGRAEVTGDVKHWQLFYIGVHPDHQNKGYGAQLLAPVLKESDKTGVPILLENFTDANTRFYERNGFEVKSRFRFDENTHMRYMVRHPGAAFKKIPHKKGK